ncbi:MAG TPA: MATE family efflux transporter [Vicinamibacteria bacterium]
MASDASLTQGRIFRLWTPLAATWLMMSVEGPFLAAVIARLPDPTFNLAAYGVAFSFATLAEAPIIMILSASTALVTDLDSYRRLRNFSFALNLAVTLAILLGLVPPVFDWIAKGLIQLPDSVAELTHRALLLLVPWPAAIGYRRFYQGILIRQDRTRRVAMGTVIRVIGMSGGAIVLFRYFELPGALVGAGALSVGVVLEAIGTRFMAWGVRERIESASPRVVSETLTFRRIAEFYFPLALTSVIALGVQPTETFFIGGSRRAIDSLAVLPVITSLTFIFRSIGLSYQEAAIALLDGTRENFRRVSTFAASVGVATTAGLGLIAFTPLAHVWFRDVSGLSPELSQFAILPLRILATMPFFSMQLAYQRAILVFGRATRSVTLSTMIEVATIVLALYLTIHVLDWVGAVAAVSALLAGRIVGNAYMMYACKVVLSSIGMFREQLGSVSRAIAPASHPDVS